MTTTKLTEKCQTTVPASVRRSLGIGPGSQVEWLEVPGGGYTIVPKTQSAKRLKGMLQTNLPPVSIEQMNADIADAVAEANR